MYLTITHAIFFYTLLLLQEIQRQSGDRIPLIIIME